MRLTPAQKSLLVTALRAEADPLTGHHGAWVERYAEPPRNGRTGDSLIAKGYMRQATRHVPGSYTSTLVYGFEITDAGRKAVGRKGEES